jgi:hypothetical protein
LVKPPVPESTPVRVMVRALVASTESRVLNISVTKPLNYTEFWSNAVSAADRVELKASADDHSRGQLPVWPRVFVYDLVPPFSDYNLSNASLHDIIGRPTGCSGHQHTITCSSFVWDTNHYGAANMLAWRVYHSPKYRVFSPEDVSHRSICYPRPMPTFVRPYARFTPSRVVGRRTSF